MLQKSKYFLGGIFLIAMSLMIAFAASGSGKWENFGTLFKNIYGDKEKNKTIAMLDGEPISKQEYDAKKVFLTYLYEKVPSSQDIMEKIVYDKILLIEAKKLNLYPTKEETLAYMQKIRDIKENVKSDGVNIDDSSERSWQEILKGQGMTEEEYWNSENTIKGYQTALAIAKVRSKLAQDWGFSGKKMATPEGMADYEKKLNDMINERKSVLKLEYLEPGLVN
ncbi:MAG TPA: hypothetical protein GXX25_09255 [Desulfotomaculum sp.]|nr:hypothetical protein [Desulfotomaculum sp.]